MVTLQILVLSFLVRIQVAQQEKRKGGTDIVSPFLLYGCDPGSSAPQHMPPMHDGLGQENGRMPHGVPASDTKNCRNHHRCQNLRQGQGQPNAHCTQRPGEQNKARYQKHESAQHGKTRSRQHLPDALVIPYHGKVRNKENEPRPDIGEPLYRNTCGDIARIQEKSHELFREKARKRPSPPYRTSEQQSMKLPESHAPVPSFRCPH